MTPLVGALLVAAAISAQTLVDRQGPLHPASVDRQGPLHPASVDRQGPLRPASGTATVRGQVVDARTAAPLRDARVELVAFAERGRGGRSVKTDADGRFRFDGVAAGPHALTVSTIGYIFVRRLVDVPAGTVVDLAIPLADGTGTYQETVTVSAEAARPAELGVAGQMTLGSAGLLDLRGVAADDPMRAVQALPGATTGDDFQAEFSVRGSAFRHVGVVIDGIATPLLLHAVRGQDDSGSVAMINSDVLDRAALLSGAHPQRHGDWLGATLDFGVREGSRDRLQLRASVSGTSASAVLEGPLAPARRGSWLISVRKSYVGWLIRKLEPEIDSTIDFADAQSKAVLDLTNRQQVQLLVIGGTATYRQDQTGLANGLLRAVSRSGVASLTWRYTRDRVVFHQRAALVRSTFENSGVLGQDLGNGDAQAVIARTDLTWTPASAWTVDAGGRSEWQRQDQTLRVYSSIGGGRIQPRASRGVAIRTTTAGGWAQLARRTDRSGMAVGARATSDSASGRSVVSPWLLAERRMHTFTLKGGIGRSHQWPPFEAVDATGAMQAPEQAISIDLAIEQRVTKSVEWRIAIFGRQDEGLLRRTGEERIVGSTRLAPALFPIFATTLDGTSRGVDVTLMRRAASGLTGWVAYTWAHTKYRDTATSELFDADFDQRHTLNVFLQQRLSYRASVNAKLRVGSGTPLIGYFDGTTSALRLGATRNSVRLPLYARLDARASRTFTFERRRLTLFAEVVNLLGRRNLGQADGVVRSSLEATGFAERLVPRVPSVGFLIEF